MKKYNTALWVQNLESIYKQALTAQPTKPFFLAVYDYVNYVLTTDTLAQLSDVFFVHKKTDYEAAEQYKKELIDYILGLMDKLEKYQTDDQSEKTAINDIFSIRKGQTQVLGDPEGWLSIFGHIEGMAWHSFRENSTARRDTLKILGVEEHDNTQIIKWPAQDIHKRYKVELEKMERLRETRGWWAWEHFRLFYDLMNDYEGIQKDTADKEKWFQAINLSYMKNEIEAILKNITYDQMKVFIYTNFITYLHKVHRQLINEIAQFEAASKATGQVILGKDPNTHTQFIFDDATATLEMNGKQIRFKKDTRKLLLFKLLLKKPKGIYYDEAVEKLEGLVTDETMNTKNIYYEACRGIEMSLGKLGVTDFLQFDYNQAKINSIYKRSSK